MKSLPEATKDELSKYWVFCKSKKPYSHMPLDQAHEQNNDLVKGSGGAVGLTENPVAFRRWMVAGPEQARIIREFEDQYLDIVPNEQEQHHNVGHAAQTTFQTEVNKLMDTFSSMGNPFREEGNELLAVDSHDCPGADVSSMVHSIEEKAQMKYDNFKQQVFIDRSTSIHQPIKKSNLPTFTKTGAKPKTKVKTSQLKQDCNLFSWLYISTQVRTANMDDFFSHENSVCLPALSDNGKLRLPTKKSEILESLDTGRQPDHSPEFDVKVVDGASIIHALPVNQASTFDEYAQHNFLSWVHRQLQVVKRLDVVWDSYFEDSLKETTRSSRGKGKFYLLTTAQVV